MVDPPNKWTPPQRRVKRITAASGGLIAQLEAVLSPAQIPSASSKIRKIDAVKKISAIKSQHELISSGRVEVDSCTL